MCRKELAQQAWGYLGRTVCRVVPWLVFESLDFCSHHSLPNKRVALCARFVYASSMVYTEHQFYLWESGILAEVVCVLVTSLWWNLGHRVYQEFVWYMILHIYCHSLMLRELGPVRSTGKELLEACIWVPFDLVTCAFTFCWFCFVSICFNKS